MMLGQLKSWLQDRIVSALDPAICLTCKTGIRSLHYFCDSCLQRLRHVSQPCSLCGKPQSLPADICAKCLYDPPYWDSMITPLIYRGLCRDLLIQFKYQHQIYMARCLTHVIRECFISPVSPPEVILPVPLHANRLIERGFNQAEEIARLLSGYSHIPVDLHALKRVRSTPPQSGLSASHRARNLIKAFEYEPRQSYRHIALVDDIVTTGSTIHEISKTVKRRGVSRIDIWGIARAIND